MTLLTGLLILKIGVTFFGVAAPFLLLPKARIDALLGGHAGSAQLYRLYGVALMALLTGYAGAILAVEGGRFPLEIVTMGIVSNGGAAVVLALTRPTRLQAALMVFFALVTASLILALFSPELALSTLI